MEECINGLREVRKIKVLRAIVQVVLITVLVCWFVCSFVFTKSEKKTSPVKGRSHPKSFYVFDPREEQLKECIKGLREDCKIKIRL